VLPGFDFLAIRAHGRLFIEYAAAACPDLPSASAARILRRSLPVLQVLAFGCILRAQTLQKLFPHLVSAQGAFGLQ